MNKKKIIILAILGPVFLGGTLFPFVFNLFNAWDHLHTVEYVGHIPKEYSKGITPITVTLPAGLASQPELELQIIPQEIIVIQGINNTITWKNQDIVPITMQEDNGLFYFSINEKRSHGKWMNPGEYSYHVESSPEVKGKITVIQKPFEKLQTHTFRR